MQAASTILRPWPPINPRLHAGSGQISEGLSGRLAPTATRARRAHASEHYYVGRRPRATEVYVVTGTNVEPLEHLGYQTGARFDWGDVTPGALELAFAMLAHTTESRPPEPICTTFRADVIAGLDPAGFVLGDGDIALWLLTAFCDGAHRDPSEPRRTIGIRHAARALRLWLRRS